MAIASIALINAFRETAQRLQQGAHYTWGNHGACNCGSLLQTISGMSEAEILRAAHEGTGEWTELAQEFCPVTGAPLHLVVTKLQQAGLQMSDIHHIEYLDDKEVLHQLPGGFRWLQRNKRDDVIAYFNAFANALEEKLCQHLQLPATTDTPTLNYRLHAI